MVGVYAENKIQWAEKFRSVVALRGDTGLLIDVTSLDHAGQWSGASTTLLPSPKLSLIFRTVGKNGSFMRRAVSVFHSNDGRGAARSAEPVSAENLSRDQRFRRIPGLIQTKGAEIGARTLALPHLQSTLSLWYSGDSELQQDGDTGGTIASKQPSDRYGVEWASYYTPVKHTDF